ncbi:hypothetical protein RSOLAG1IB_08391 [Rhizoctonia solani AG-1 IB]|uniref:Uncharacterized protein n=1 Tax=Thanatephorus cucumeris (strain AG1-IB / isolate 7/3/14) TaxID=1108050 RepID=M5BYF9_THACB|nr:hypothetical protein BN14_02770 [Rhizoctonia solani AG-1 IB]CEL57158.1 hypothetical protein RSOLAG1IB_08391 [Rhizoctonia solani AG-1 IB]
MESLKNVRIGHAASSVGHAKLAKRIQEKRAGCSLYTAPTAGSIIDSVNKTFTMTWSASCVDKAPSMIDIYLSAPNSKKAGVVHVWQKVNFAAGTYTDVLKPKWWDSTSNISLQLSFVESQTPLFLSDLPVGPTWNAFYNATSAAGAVAAADTSAPDPVYQSVNNNSNGGGLSKGALASAVIFPILTVAVALLVYVKFSRKKEAKKRQRWSQAMDKRMSTISKDWAGARPSMAGSRNTRASSWYVAHMGNQPGRPSSAYVNESGQAGIGARYGPDSPGVHPSSVGSGPEMGQVRPRALSSLNASDRISRISFAGDSRPSMGDSMRPAISHGTPTRAFHSATLVSDDIEMSPTQTSGPYSLSADEIRAKVAQGQEYGRSSVDGDLRDDILQMPAATHLRTGQTNGSDDFLVRPDSMTLAYGGVEDMEPPAPVHNALSPTGSMPMVGPDASPDDMMRAYAHARTTGTSTPSQGMRTLYAPANADALSPAAAPGAEDRNPYRKSMNSEASRYSEADVGRAA